MSDGSMFADVMKFIDSSYFDSHNYGWLSTPNAVYKIDFFSVSQPENYDDFYDVNSDVNLWLDDLRANSFIWRNIGISENDQFISLSTCTDSEAQFKDCFDRKNFGGLNMKKRTFIALITAALMTALCGLTAYASGDVAGAVESTWSTARTQIISVVDNVVFPVIDVMLAVLLFVKVTLAYLDYRKHGQLEWAPIAIIFGCLIFL